ncbi:MAG: hypothetical protein ACLGH0_12085 [Thermoanaerobaculia bacterium]
MKFRNVITAAAIAALPFAAQAASFVVPAAGTGPGSNNSQWQSELTLHTAAPRAVSLLLTFHQASVPGAPVEVTLQPKETVSIADVVKTKFGVVNGTGAIVIEVADRDAKTLAVTSRTFNTSAEGEFGQDIPAVEATNALRSGDIAAIAGPSVASGNRFNFGLYVTEEASIEWQLLRANGTVAATKTLTYDAGQHVQYNNGVKSLFEATAQNNDTVHAKVASGRAIFYGSVINATGDPTFVPGVRTREDVVIHFAGLDLDEDGTVDIGDTNEDGVLDATIDVASSLFPSYFRIVASDELGQPVTFEVVSSPAQTELLDANGTLRVIAAGDVKGKTGEILIKATTGASSSVLTIPVRFK